jgi:hypothetical protein
MDDSFSRRQPQNTYPLPAAFPMSLSEKLYFGDAI